jgi:hypothetical protein
VHFLQAMQAPVVVELPQMGQSPSRILHIPKLEIDDIVAWGAEREAEIVESATSQMNEFQKREYMALYPPSSPDLNELRRLVYTPPGIKKVLQLCLPKAKVFEKTETGPGRELDPLFPEEVQQLLKANGTGALSRLAFAVADLVDQSMVVPPKAGEKAPKGDGDVNPTKPASETNSKA